jgi:hypothetical protein
MAAKNTRGGVCASTTSLAAADQVLEDVAYARVAGVTLAPPAATSERAD